MSTTQANAPTRALSNLWKLIQEEVLDSKSAKYRRIEAEMAELKEANITNINSQVNNTALSGSKINSGVHENVKLQFDIQH